jgi:hypothetical protein
MNLRELELTMETGLEALRSLPVNDEAEQAKALLLPEGLHPVVEFVPRGDDGTGGRANEWNPSTGHILISFRRADESSSADHDNTCNGSRGSEMPSRFHPVPIRGEAGSLTLLADRGSV